MFERFTDAVSMVRMIKAGDIGRLQKVVSAGAKVNRRTTYDPWMTPLDAAASTKNIEAIRVLLGAGAQILGSSIYEAILQDADEVLRLFLRVDPVFYRGFWRDLSGNRNPRLNRWLSMFTALDFSESIHADCCTKVLKEAGAPQQLKTRQHYRDQCTAVYIKETSFISVGGVNNDGLSEVTSGYYCAKCNHFVR